MRIGGGMGKVAKSDRKSAKKATNLTLDPEAVARGDRFGQRHGISLSQLVTSFLYGLPGEGPSDALADLSPPVRRLYGLAAGGPRATVDRDTYRAHLVAKYGQR